jgi:hypothetical protein
MTAMTKKNLDDLCEVLAEARWLVKNGTEFAIIGKGGIELKIDLTRRAGTNDEDGGEMKDYSNVGAVCRDCAQAAGFTPKDKVAGVWMGKCGICGKQDCATSDLT